VKREGEISGEGDDRWDPVVGERGEKEQVGLVRGGLGRQASRAWPKWAPGLFLLFFFLLFPFSLLF
jgi:hypothetical protein